MLEKHNVLICKLCFCLHLRFVGEQNYVKTRGRITTKLLVEGWGRREVWEERSREWVPTCREREFNISTIQHLTPPLPAPPCSSLNSYPLTHLHSPPPPQISSLCSTPSLSLHPLQKPHLSFLPIFGVMFELELLVCRPVRSGLHLLSSFTRCSHTNTNCKSSKSTSAVPIFVPAHYLSCIKRSFWLVNHFLAGHDQIED